MGLRGKIFGAVALVGIGQGVVSCAVNDSSPFDRSVEKWAYYTGQNVILMLNALAVGALNGVNEILSENPDREIIITEGSDGKPSLVGFVEPDGTHMLLQSDGSFREVLLGDEAPKIEGGYNIDTSPA